MDKSFVDWALSAMVLAVAALFAWFAYSTTHQTGSGGYPISARFHTIAGLPLDADVKIAGIKVGRVIGMEITPDTFDARIVLSLDPQIKLPTDSTAHIASDGLLGGTYLAIEPGKAGTRIAAGGELTETESPEDIVQTIGKMIFGGN